MRQFDAAPPIPLGYPRLQALRKQEIGLAISASYVAETNDPREPVRRPGLDNYDWRYLDDDIRDWCVRAYMIWFCYLFEVMHLLRKPMTAFEELFMEFRAPGIIDLPGRPLASLYAGTGGSDPLSAEEIEDQRKKLRPNYDKAISLLAEWQSRH